MLRHRGHNGQKVTDLSDESVYDILMEIVAIVIFELLISMDYEKLYEQLPKRPIHWNVHDIELWLRFVGLSNLYSKFKQLSIDGSCITFLTEQDLRDELNIQSGIIIKKILTWVSRGFNEFTSFVENKQAAGFPETREVTQKPKAGELPPSLAESKPLCKSSTNKQFLNMPMPNSIVPQQLVNEGAGDQENLMAEESLQSKMKEFQLVIHQSDGPQTSFFSVKEQGAKIGRHSSNQILILDESISRYHAEIKFSEASFYLKDIGSTTGTFIKIEDRKHIYHSMIIEMGSNQFQAALEAGALTLSVIEGPALALAVEIPRQTKVTVGRKPNNFLHFQDDQHLSNIHSTISYSDGKFFIEDMGTTNGTWERLSMQGEASELFQIQDKTVFKIGSNQTYVCKIKMSLVSQKLHHNACVICCEQEKDCVYMPCKHNTACIKCSKNLKECPICRTKIEDYVRIYKA